MIELMNAAAGARALQKRLDEDSDLYEVALQHQAEKDVENDYYESLEEAYEVLRGEGFGSSWDQDVMEDFAEAARAELLEAGDAGPEPRAYHAGFQFEALRQVPSLGSHEPEGFELVEQLFVDKTGFGERDEPALTFSQFVAEVQRLIFEGDREVIYLSLGEEGQFQIYVNAWRREMTPDEALDSVCGDGTAETLRALGDAAQTFGPQQTLGIRKL